MSSAATLNALGMHQLGDFWVWAAPGGRRLLLGNAAAAQEAALARPADKVQLPDIPAPSGLAEFGAYALPGGPVVRLRMQGGAQGLPFARLFAPLASLAPADCTLDYLLLDDGMHALWRDGAIIAHGLEPDLEKDMPSGSFSLIFELLRALFAHQEILAVLHGAAVEWQGRRIVFMGQSGSGKSTLAGLCAAKGGRYLGDDSIVLIGPQAQIHPVPLAPSIKSGSWPVLAPHFPQLNAAPEFISLGRRIKYLDPAPFADTKGPPDLLVFPRFDPKAEPKAVALTPIETFLHLSRAGLWLQPDRCAPFVDLVRNLPAIVLRHGPDFARTEALMAEHLP